MNKITCIGKVVAKKEHHLIVKEELLKLLEPTRNEDGCINYDLHMDRESANIFFFHDTWESEAHLNAHLESEHVKSCIAIIGDF